MAKIVDPYLDALKTLVELNKTIKHSALLYSIYPDRTIYMSSIIPFIEKVAIVNESVFPIIQPLIQTAISSPAVTSFGAAYTKTNTVYQFDKEKVCYEDKKKELELVLPNLLNVEVVPDNMRELVHPMYHRFLTDAAITSEFDNAHLQTYTEFDETAYAAIRDKKLAIITLSENNDIYIAKPIFGNVTKTLSLGYRLTGIVSPDCQEKQYVMFEQVEPMCTIYTLVAFITRGPNYT